MHDSVLCQGLDFFQEVAEDQSVSTALQPGRCLEVVVNTVHAISIILSAYAAFQTRCLVKKPIQEIPG